MATPTKRSPSLRAKPNLDDMPLSAKTIISQIQTCQSFSITKLPLRTTRMNIALGVLPMVPSNNLMEVKLKLYHKQYNVLSFSSSIDYTYIDLQSNTT